MRLIDNELEFSGAVRGKKRLKILRHPKSRGPGTVWWLVLAAFCLVLAAPLGAQEKPALAPDTLLEVLTNSSARLEKDIAAATAETEALQQDLEQAEVDLQNLQVRTATLKASQVAGELQFKEAQTALESFSTQEKKAAARLAEAREEREKLAKQLADRTNAFNDLKQQVDRLKATKHPSWTPPEVRKAYSRYQQLARQYQTDAGEVLKLSERLIAVLEQQDQVLTNITTELQSSVEGGKKEWLLEKRQPLVSIGETVQQTWQTFWELPARLVNYLGDPELLPQTLRSLRLNWAQFLGLLAILLLLVWTAPRLGRRLRPNLERWQAEAETGGLKVIFKAGELVFTHLFSLGFIAWLALAIGIMGWWQQEEARVILLGVAVGVGLRLGFKLIQAVFAGREHGGLIPCEETSLRFYRRQLKLLLVYVLVIEIFGLHFLQLLDLDPATYANLETLSEGGFMVWLWWLLRRRPLDNLRPEIPEPAWPKVRFFFLTVRVFVLLVVVTIFLTALLGFQNLASYLARGASLTGLLVVLVWVTWQAARAVLDHALYPEPGRVPGEARGQDEVLKKYSLALAKVVVTVLVFGAVFLILKLWGLDLGFLGLFSQVISWGPRLGPFSLNLLNLGLAALTLYLGRWFSRFLRALLEVRFFPKTDWDESIRYTIGNTFHYTVQAIAILMALGFLGVSFGDVAIIAGGLGVGIGFGLQNIVNNFISGLILLFERPIKVGDMLVIDGQWGLVKEIRVRSTIFQTFDRYVLIIPNSELISNKVLNWTHYGPGINRLTLKIGVSYSSDVRQVTKILDEVCRANPRVLADPPPNIFFEAYGDSSLDFNIWVFLRSPSDRIPATHELNSAIFEAFQEHGIEIPFPQRDLHIKTWPGASGSPPLPPESAT
jgi:potassium-dependent mechanosensitive channel